MKKNLFIIMFFVFCSTITAETSFKLTTQYQKERRALCDDCLNNIMGKVQQRNGYTMWLVSYGSLARDKEIMDKYTIDKNDEYGDLLIDEMAIMNAFGYNKDIRDAIMFKYIVPANMRASYSSLQKEGEAFINKRIALIKELNQEQIDEEMEIFLAHQKAVEYKLTPAGRVKTAFNSWQTKKELEKESAFENRLAIYSVQEFDNICDSVLRHMNFSTTIEAYDVETEILTLKIFPYDIDRSNRKLCEGISATCHMDLSFYENMCRNRKDERYYPWNKDKTRVNEYIKKSVQYGVVDGFVYPRQMLIGDFATWNNFETAAEVTFANDMADVVFDPQEMGINNAYLKGHVYRQEDCAAEITELYNEINLFRSTINRIDREFEREYKKELFPSVFTRPSHSSIFTLDELYLMGVDENNKISNEYNRRIFDLRLPQLKIKQIFKLTQSIHEEEKKFKTIEQNRIEFEKIFFNTRMGDIFERKISRTDYLYSNRMDGFYRSFNEYFVMYFPEFYNRTPKEWKYYSNDLAELAFLKQLLKNGNIAPRAIDIYNLIAIKYVDKSLVGQKEFLKNGVYFGEGDSGKIAFFKAFYDNNNYKSNLKEAKKAYKVQKKK